MNPKNIAPNPMVNDHYDNPWRGAHQDTSYMHGALSALSPELYQRALHGTVVPRHGGYGDPSLEMQPMNRRGYINYDGRHASLRTVIGFAFTPELAETQAKGRIVRQWPGRQNPNFDDGAAASVSRSG